MTEDTNEYPLFITHLHNDTGNSLAVNFPAIALSDGEISRIVALPYIPSRNPDASEMLALSVNVAGEEQNLYLSYDYTDSIPPIFTLCQIDNNGSLSTVEMSGTFENGGVVLNFVLDGGILIIGTVEVDIDPTR